ncbi:MAG TPA: HEAT repeat domain-containing protein, partial [Polyangiales bacterium]|nr:HEAT repeat domain-containing protein [Polyangiales bacterium]
MKRLLDRASGVRPQEADLVVTFFCFFTGVGMFYTVGCTVGDTLFLSNLPAGRVPVLLPWVYLGVGVANIAAALAFDALSARLPRRVLIIGVQVILAIFVVVFRQLIELSQPWLYYALVIWMELSAILSITLFYSFAGDYFSPRDARRLYGFIAGGMALGTVVSGEAIHFAVPLVGTKNLLYAGAAILLGNAALALRIVRIGKPILHEAPQEQDEPERAPLRAVFARPYVRYLAVVIPLAIALGVVTDYQMKWVASAKAEQELARFFGSFFAWVGFLQIVFQFGLVPRLLNRLGIINCLMILPLALASSSLVMVAAHLPLLLVSASVNSLRMIISETLDIPSRELLFLPLPTRIRVRAQPLLVGAVAPATQGLAGLFLLGLLGLGVHVERLSLIVLLLSASLVLALVRLRPRYRETLAATLREHQLDPTDLERILQSPTVTPVLEELLRSDDPEVARATLDLIKDRDLAALAPVLESLVQSEHVSVAIGSLKLLVRARGTGATPIIERALESGRREVRKAAVLALCEVTGVDALPRMRESLSSNDRSQRNSAIIGLARHCGEQGITLARPDLEEMARSKYSTARVEAAELIGEIGTPGYADLLGPLLADSQADVRKAAAEACAKIVDPALVPLLIAKLGDATLQSSVLRALERTPRDAIDPLTALLRDTARPARQRAVIARLLSRIGGEAALAALVEVLDA